MNSVVHSIFSIQQYPGKCRSKHKEVMDKSRKWLKLDPDKEEECDPRHSAAAYGLRNR